METFSVPESPGVAIRLIAGFTCYAVGDDGSVWSCSTRCGALPEGWRRVSIYRRTYGARYCVVCLRENDGKGKVICRYVHRLVLEAFVGPCPPGMEACHGDGNTENNRRTNLRWDTKSANNFDTVLHGTIRSKIGPPQVLEIRRLIEEGADRGLTAVAFGISRSQVSNIARRGSWAGV